MPRTVRLPIHIPAPLDRVWEEVQTSRLLHYVAHPLIRFRPVGGKSFPKIWAAGEYKAWMLLFGFLPIGWQIIGIEYPPSNGDTKQLRDNGRGMMIRTWDHMITVEPDDNGTRYTDTVEVEAGILTLPVSWFARLFYAHRQRRWLKLARNDFRYD